MKSLSLFTGIGGFDAGFEAAGLKTMAMCEIDNHAQNVLRYHWPNMEILSDVRSITRTTLPFRPDLICGGFPCQDLSVAGKRKGLAGERSGLWHEFDRIIGELKPRVVVIENVPGLLSSNGGADLAVILRGLENRGYWWSYRVLDSQFFGLAQRRRRVFIVASLGNASCVKILFESESLRRNPAEGRKAGQGVANCIEASTPGSKQRADASDNLIVVGLKGVCGAVSSKWAKGTSGPAGDECQNLVTHALPARSDSSEDGTGRGTPLVLTEKVSVRAASGGSSKTYVANVAHSLGTRQFSPTTSPSGQQTDWCIVQNMAVRRLTPTECEALQGFPRNWTKYGRTEDGQIIKISDTQRYKMLGNAISVSVAEWIGRRIVKFTEGM